MGTTLNVALLTRPQELGTNFEHLGSKSGLYLQKNENGWSLVRLNFLQQCIRYLCGCFLLSCFSKCFSHPSTYFKTVIHQIKMEGVQNLSPQFMQKIQNSWTKTYRREAFPLLPQTAPSSTPPTAITQTAPSSTLPTAITQTAPTAQTTLTQGAPASLPPSPSTSIAPESHDWFGWNQRYRNAASPHPLLVDIFQQTGRACSNGYTHNGQVYRINQDIESMQRNTRVYQSTTSLPSARGHAQVVVSVVNQDTLDTALELKRRGRNPVALNFANATHPCGNAAGGAQAQEEDLTRRTALALSLYPSLNPHLERQLINGTYRISDFGAIYSKNVPLIRGNQSGGFAFVPPEQISMIASAAYDLNPRHGVPPLNPNTLEFVNGMRAKIRSILRIAILEGHDSIVLGAFGCGAFRCPPNVVANIFRDIFREAEFRGEFLEIVFAVLDRPGGANITQFQSLQGMIV